jgi:hypothetical protein
MIVIQSTVYGLKYRFPAVFRFKKTENSKKSSLKPKNQNNQRVWILGFFSLSCDNGTDFWILKVFSAMGEGRVPQNLIHRCLTAHAACQDEHQEVHSVLLLNFKTPPSSDNWNKSDQNFFIGTISRILLKAVIHETCAIVDI